MGRRLPPPFKSAAKISSSTQAASTESTQAATTQSTQAASSASTQAASTQAPADIISMQLELDTQTTVNLTNETTQEYIEFKGKIKQSLEAYYRRKLGNAFRSVTVLSMRQGSVLVNYTLSTESDVKGEVIDAVRDLVQGTETVSIDGTATLVKSGVIQAETSEIVLDKDTPADNCQIYTSLVSCSADTVCVIQSSGVPACKPVVKNDNFSLILGLAIGIPVFFVLAFIIALICILMRKNKKSKRLREEDDWDARNYPHLSLPYKYDNHGFYKHHYFMPDNMELEVLPTEKAFAGNAPWNVTAGFEQWDEYRMPRPQMYRSPHPVFVSDT
uniref:SEA domain-containing protein n=1 Tax=Magallana gigas TaxID=29159 RepID=A0A8W8L9T3_MAGGI